MAERRQRVTIRRAGQRLRSACRGIRLLLWVRILGPCPGARRSRWARPPDVRAHRPVWFGFCLALALTTPAAALDLTKADGSIRVATFNAALARKGAGVLIHDLRKGDPQAANVAEIIRLADADILLINELDYDPEGRALGLFLDLLTGPSGKPLYPHVYQGDVNTGIPSRMDLDRDGRTMGPGDAWGYGRFPGQYGMALLSRFPLDAVRTFRNLRWADAPWAVAPVLQDGAPWYPPAAWDRQPLSSKSHWDIRVRTPFGPVHILASHPTPPVFDGPEDRNGLRNAAEIRFWSDYIGGRGWMTDDQGQSGSLPATASFVLVGDLNADPNRGDGRRAMIRALLDDPRLQDPRPTSPGARATGRADATADWPEDRGPGNMRVDYALASRDLTVTGAGVFWPAPGDPMARLTMVKGRKQASSDHRLVWVDIRTEQ